MNETFPELGMLHDRRLREFETMTFHPEMGTAAAMVYCAEHGLHPPRWLLVASASLIMRLLKSAKSHKSGRAAGCIARYRQDMIDYARWEAVMEVRRKQKEVAERITFLRSHPIFRERHPEHFRAEEKLAKWTGRKWDRAFECASMLLEGSEAFGGPASIKRSYRNVQSRLKRVGPADGRYLLLDPMFLRRMGIPRSRSGLHPAKVQAIFDLTLTQRPRRKIQLGAKRCERAAA